MDTTHSTCELDLLFKEEMSKTKGEKQYQSIIQFPVFKTNVPLSALLEIKGNLAENLKKCKQLWNAYETVTKLNNKLSY